jgi:pimeloyl-ACP methyl ester carboxylesterase
MVLGWIFGVLFGITGLVLIAVGKILPAIPLLLIAFLLIPPVAAILRNKVSRKLHWLISGFGIFLLLIAFVFISIVSVVNQPLYKSPEVRERLMHIYDAKLKEWPVPYETKYVDTEYGKVYVIVSGPEHAPPVLLIHAASLPSWSWLNIIEGLNTQYRTYAIDYIGEANKSILDDLNTYPADGKALSDLYADISTKLGVDNAYVIGASNGGYIAANYARYAHERVKKLVLLGPMGVTPATASVAFRLMLATFFPIKPFKDAMYSWALGDNPVVHKVCGEWLRLIIDGTGRKGPPPLTFTPEQLQRIETPVLLVLGTKDDLVGDPKKVIPLARNIPDIRIEILNTAHCIWIERPDRINALIFEFLEQD